MNASSAPSVDIDQVHRWGRGAIQWLTACTRSSSPSGRVATSWEQASRVRRLRLEAATSLRDLPRRPEVKELDVCDRRTAARDVPGRRWLPRSRTDGRSPRPPAARAPSPSVVRRGADASITVRARPPQPATSSTHCGSTSAFARRPRAVPSSPEVEIDDDVGASPRHAHDTSCAPLLAAVARAAAIGRGRACPERELIGSGQRGGVGRGRRPGPPDERDAEPARADGEHEPEHDDGEHQRRDRRRVRIGRGSPLHSHASPTRAGRDPGTAPRRAAGR